MSYSFQEWMLSVLVQFWTAFDNPETLSSILIDFQLTLAIKVKGYFVYTFSKKNHGIEKKESGVTEAKFLLTI